MFDGTLSATRMGSYLPFLLNLDSVPDQDVIRVTKPSIIELLFAELNHCSTTDSAD